MNIFTEHPHRYHLIAEMLEAPDLIERFDSSLVQPVYDQLSDVSRLMLTGEGSSRIFPARNVIAKSQAHREGPVIISETATDLASKNLMDYAIIGASNSGRTKELVNLFHTLHEQGHPHLYALTCTADSLLEKYAGETVVLHTGKEQAVAATKSVMVQAFFYDVLYSCWTGQKINPKALAEDLYLTLQQNISQEITDVLAKADHIFFAGVNNGVAEELALKTNETVRKKSAFFPGTYLLHGVEEVVGSEDVLVLVDYLPDHARKIHEVFVENIGAKVLTFSSEETMFPHVSFYSRHVSHESYAKLAAGWKILAETGTAMGIDLDKPQRARKIGNEMESVS